MKVDGNTSDGYHTFNELYEFRKLYNALFFNELSAQRKYITYKSRCTMTGKNRLGAAGLLLGHNCPQVKSPSIMK